MIFLFLFAGPGTSIWFLEGSSQPSRGTVSPLSCTPVELRQARSPGQGRRKGRPGSLALSCPTGLTGSGAAELREISGCTFTPRANQVSLPVPYSVPAQPCIQTRKGSLFPQTGTACSQELPGSRKPPVINYTAPSRRCLLARWEVCFQSFVSGLLTALILSSAQRLRGSSHKPSRGLLQVPARLSSWVPSSVPPLLAHLNDQGAGRGAEGSRAGCSEPHSSWSTDGNADLH